VERLKIKKEIFKNAGNESFRHPVMTELREYALRRCI